MFSKNRFNGHHGAGVSPKGGTKAKAHPPKKRSPNPRVALVIRGKIHRLLQGSVDHRIPDSHLYYAGIEDEDCHKQDGRKEHRGTYPKTDPDAPTFSSAKLSNGKGHGVTFGPPCVGEVELNREGCIRIPCTLQHKSGRPPANRKRISFEGEIPTSPEQMRKAPHYSAVGPDMNGSKFVSAVGRNLASPRVRPKRPYSAGDCLDYNFNRAVPDTLAEEDGDCLGVDKEEESSAIIEHILKELRGINKIQEEISDLRDYLTSVRGSVEEVSSCVDAVLLEIEGFRSSNKASSEGHAGTWSGVGCKDGPSSRRRPASAYGSLGSAMPKSDSKFFPEVYNEHLRIHGELLLPREEESTITETVDHQELEEAEDASDHSSDIPVGAVARKLSFGYLERQDGQDCPSISSLSSHSSKSESDLERPSSSHGRNQQRDGNGKERWTTSQQLHSLTGESVWHREPVYVRDRSLDSHVGESLVCYKESSSWDHCGGEAGYGRLGQHSTGSSEHLSVRSSKHFNSPASASSREERQQWQEKTKAQSGICFPKVTSTEHFEAEYECSAERSYPKSSSYYSYDRRNAGDQYNYGQSNDPDYNTGCRAHSYEEMISTYDESSAVTWTEASRCSNAADVGKQLTQQMEASYQSLDNQLRHTDKADVQPGGFNVRRISRAVLDFRSALRGALRKIEVPGAPNPGTGEETEFEISMLSDAPETEALSKVLNSERHLEQACDENPQNLLYTRNDTSNKSKVLFVEPVLEEVLNTLTLESSDPSQYPPSPVKSPPLPEDISMFPGTSTSLKATPPPNGSTEHFPEGFEDLSADVNTRTQLSQCSTTESLSASLTTELPAKTEGQGEVDESEQLAPDVSVAPEVKAEGDVAEPLLDISQMDERKLKCLRSFQQILREKRETRRNLASVTMSTISQDDFEQGRHHLQHPLKTLMFCSAIGIEL